MASASSIVSECLQYRCSEGTACTTRKEDWQALKNTTRTATPGKIWHSHGSSIVSRGSAPCVVALMWVACVEQLQQKSPNSNNMEVSVIVGAHFLRPGPAPILKAVLPALSVLAATLLDVILLWFLRSTRRSHNKPASASSAASLIRVPHCNPAQLHKAKRHDKAKYDWCVMRAACAACACGVAAWRCGAMFDVFSLNP